MSRRARHARVLELRDKLQKLEASAGLTQKRAMFERAVAWAMVRERLGVLAAQKQLLEVRQRAWWSQGAAHRGARGVAAALRSAQQPTAPWCVLSTRPPPPATAACCNTPGHRAPAAAGDCIKGRGHQQAAG
jgi:hypothetical protein